MPSFASLFALAAPMMVLAAPAPMRRDSAGDLGILKFADVLEQFEAQFYQQALVKFQENDFIVAGFVSAQLPVEQFTLIQGDEATHQTVLESVITSNGDSPITDCKIDFGSALNDVATMAATARLVENVGVGAYLGAAHLLESPSLLTAAGSILTVEARHQTILNVLTKGTSIPQAFDIGLLPNEVLAIAGAFISGCELGVEANPPLTVTNTDTVQPGTLLTFDSPALNSSSDNVHCHMLVGGASCTLVFPVDNCVVPDGIDGPVAIFLTNEEQPLNGDVVLRASQQVLAGPTMAFIDTKTQLLSQLVLAGSNSSDSGNNSANDSSATTSTISTSEASSIISSASAASSTVAATGTQGAVAPVSTEVPLESDKTQVDAPGTRNIASGDFGAITVDGWQDLIGK